MREPHVEAELLAYLDGELDAPERARVESHLARCPRCADALERLRGLRWEVDATLDAALTPVRLPAAADRRIRDRLRARTEPGWRWRLWQGRGLVAQALLALLVVLSLFATTQSLGLPAPRAAQETLVLGQDRLVPGSQAALRVIVRDAEGAQPVTGADVVVRLGRTPGLASVVYTGQTDAHGTADVTFAVPGDLEGEASLVVETASLGREARVVRPIVVAREYSLFVSSDKPAYRPGQTIHLRALALEALDLRPVVDQEVNLLILDPAGRVLQQTTLATSDFGIAALDFPLPSDADSGSYTLRAWLGDTVSERTVVVDAYELPAFGIALEPDRTFYGPEERVTGSVQAEYFFGRPVVGGRVTLRGYVGGAARVPAVQVLGKTDAEGRFAFAFDLPAGLGQQATRQPVTFDLEVEVIDAAGRREGIRRVLPVAAQSILLDAVPESGRIKPGVENVIYILAAYPDGQPAEAALSVEADGERVELASGPYGLAELRLVPDGERLDLAVHARDGQGREGQETFTFESDRAPQTLLLRAERAAYEVGDTLRAEVLAAGLEDGAPVYLDMLHTQQTVATLSAPVEDGRAVFALDLDGTMVGTLELHAYSVLPQGDVVEDTRLVIVDAPRQVAVAVSADQERYRPGETAHLELQTTLTGPDAQPVQSALGIGVVDTSVYALEQVPAGFVRAYFLLERELLEARRPVQGFDELALLEAEAGIRDAQDVAARAAWAGAAGTGFTLSAKAVGAPPEGRPARGLVSQRLGLLVSVLPVLLGVVVARGLTTTGVLGRALRRVGIGALALLVGSPLVVLVVGGAMWLLWVVLGAGAPVAILAVVLVLLAGLAAHGWVRRDARIQLVTGLLGAYLAVGAALVLLAARGGDLGGAALLLVASTYLLALVALATLGQGLVLEGWRLAGWATTVMALLLVVLVIYLPFVSGLASDLTRTLGNPGLYAGPVGWMTGCAAVPATEEATQPAEAEEPTEEPTEEATEEPAGLPVGPTPPPTPTAAPPLAEPYPLRQVFPETLYWAPEALTDEAGRLTLDLPLADTVTTWRLTALASTREGELGVATYDVLVFQDLFVDLELPATARRGDVFTATVTVFNYLPREQEVRIEPATADWYSLVSSPATLTLPANDVATIQFSLRAEQAGRFSLQVTAVGEEMRDSVVSEVTVEP